MSIGTIIFTAEFFAGLVFVFAFCYFIGWLLKLDTVHGPQSIDDGLQTTNNK